MKVNKFNIPIRKCLINRIPYPLEQEIITEIDEIRKYKYINRYVDYFKLTGISLIIKYKSKYNDF